MGSRREVRVTEVANTDRHRHNHPRGKDDEHSDPHVCLLTHNWTILFLKTQRLVDFKRFAAMEFR